MRFAKKTLPAWGLALAMTSLPPSTARALQPLDAFVGAAQLHNPRLQEATANLTMQEGNADLSVGRLLPSIALRANYTRNQYNVDLPANIIPGLTQPIPIQPANQLGATGTLTVPLIDLSAFSKAGAANSAAKSSAQQRDNVALQVESQVVQTYYQLLANVALLESSEHALSVAQTSLQLTRERYTVGSAAVLDVDRAQADVERQFQQVAEVHLSVDLAARTLESLTALTPDLHAAQDSTTQLSDDLHVEQGLDTFASSDDAIPAIKLAVLASEQLTKTARAQRLALVPALSGSVMETLTNAAGFTGHDAYYAAGLALTWNFDMTTLANIKVADAAAVAARAREDQARLDAHDSLFRFWKTVETYIVRSKSAREQARVSAEAASLAQDRYAAGTATQLDLLQAQRDAFAADVSRIQADADLVNSRAQLRFAAGLHYGH